MRRPTVVLALRVLATCVLAGACAGRMMPSTRAADTAVDTAADEAEVRRVEQQVADATDHNDADALAALLSPDFVFVNPAGLLMTKERFIGAISSGRLRNSKYEISDVRVRVYGDAAVVTYRSHVAGNGMGQLVQQRWRTTMLTRRDGRWLVVAQQSTPILDYDPAVGRWTLDLAQSAFRPGPPVRNQTRTYTQTADGVRFVLDGIAATGSPMHAEYTARYDGGDYPLVGVDGATSIALTRVNTVRTDGVEKQDGRIVFAVSQIVSADGQTLTVSVNGKNAQGDSVADLLVFRRR